MVVLTTKKRWNGSAFVDLTVAKRWDGTAFVDCFDGGVGAGLSLTADSGDCIGSVFASEPAPLFTSVTSDSVTMTPTGGTAPYTHAWTLVSGSSAVLVDSPTSATTTFTGNVAKNGPGKSAVYRDTVTDALGATANATVSVFLEYTTDI